MRTYPENEEDKQDIEELKAETWMIEALKMNPEYVFWGNFEDYMIKDSKGWDSRLQFNSWKEFGPWVLDDYNEVSNFYFEVCRDSIQCAQCEGLAINQKTKEIYESFYSFDDRSKAWYNKITQEEVDELVRRGRLTADFKNPTAEEVNIVNTNGPFHKQHDGLNHWILVEFRAKKLGVYGNCQYCEGRGYLFTEENGHLDLQLWVLHPRKGCSRGVYVKNIKEEELLEVREYLKLAAKRNAERFSLL